MDDMSFERSKLVVDECDLCMCRWWWQESGCEGLYSVLEMTAAGLNRGDVDVSIGVNAWCEASDDDSLG